MQQLPDVGPSAIGRKATRLTDPAGKRDDDPIPLGPKTTTATLFQREPDLQRHLVVVHLALRDIAADLADLEPAETPQRACCLGDGVVDRLGDALLGRPDDLN